MNIHGNISLCIDQQDWNFQMCSALNCTSPWTRQWRHNEHDGVSNHQPHDCLLNHLFRSRLKKAPKFRITGLCARNSPVTGEFPTQRASNRENVSIWWRHHEFQCHLSSVSMRYCQKLSRMLCRTFLSSIFDFCTPSTHPHSKSSFKWTPW